MCVWGGGGGGGGGGPINEIDQTVWQASDAELDRWMNRYRRVTNKYPNKNEYCNTRDRNNEGFRKYQKK